MKSILAYIEISSRRGMRLSISLWWLLDTFKGEMTAVLKTNMISLFRQVVVCMTIRTFSSLKQWILMKKTLTCYYKLPRAWLHGNNEAEVNMFSCWLELAFVGWLEWRILSTIQWVSNLIWTSFVHSSCQGEKIANFQLELVLHEANIVASLIAKHGLVEFT